MSALYLFTTWFFDTKIYKGCMNGKESLIMIFVMLLSSFDAFLIVELMVYLDTV